MASRLTDKQKKKIVADYLLLESYNAVAKKNGVADSTVKRVVLGSREFKKIAEQKKEENTADILQYMESQRGIVCEIIAKGLLALNDPKKLKNATPAQITTAIGTLIDKWTVITGNQASETREDGLSKSLREFAEGMESDD